jgi:hypothetical protein
MIITDDVCTELGEELLAKSKRTRMCAFYKIIKLSEEVAKKKGLVMHRYYFGNLKPPIVVLRSKNIQENCLFLTAGCHGDEECLSSLKLLKFLENYDGERTICAFPIIYPSNFVGDDVSGDALCFLYDNIPIIMVEIIGAMLDYNTDIFDVDEHIPRVEKLTEDMNPFSDKALDKVINYGGIPLDFIDIWKNMIAGMKPVTFSKRRFRVGTSNLKLETDSSEQCLFSSLIYQRARYFFKPSTVIDIHLQTPPYKRKDYATVGRDYEIKIAKNSGVSFVTEGKFYPNNPLKSVNNTLKLVEEIVNINY